MSNSFDVALITTGTSSAAIADGVEQIALAMYKAASDQPIAAAATICVAATALYGAVKLVEVCSPAIEQVSDFISDAVSDTYYGLGYMAYAMYAVCKSETPTITIVAT